MRHIRNMLIPVSILAIFLAASCHKEPKISPAVPLESFTPEPAKTGSVHFGRNAEEDQGLDENTEETVKAGLPGGFVYIDEVIPDCIVDAKYFSSDNFLGRPVKGYEKPLVVCSREVADGLVIAADFLREQGYLLKIFDSYRPQRAVDDFIDWVKEPNDETRKEIHYPNVAKTDLIDEGYIASRSGHTRGAAVDLTLVETLTGIETDMGTCFDFLDELSRHGAKGLTEEQEKNRELLKEAMIRAGFKPYENEWWHYSIKTEPYPETYFDFPVS